MIDLNMFSGLPICGKPSTGKLLFGEGLSAVEPDVRRREEMSDVLFNPFAGEFEELYYMYRGIARPEDRTGIDNRGLRYDITVIRSGTMGGEYIKTAGHYHPLKPGTAVTYPEVYEVLHGQAQYLLQRPHGDSQDRIGAVVLITADRGDKVLVPPGFGHVTINCGKDPLIMSNWVAAGFSSVYEPYRMQGGGGYFLLRTDEGPEIRSNQRYRQLPSLHRSSARPFPAFNLVPGLPIYRLYRSDPRSLDFLINPENYGKQFTEYQQLIFAK